MKRPKVCVLRTAGTNCDKETAFAFSKVGADVELAHINTIIEYPESLNKYQILVFPGGFSYGDDIAAGKILANELRCKLSDEIKKFITEGRLVIGICNGFQILVKAGLLPGNDNLEQEASLIINDSGKFEDRWVSLKLSSSQCVWTRDLPGVIYLPVAHGEGKFMLKDKTVLASLKKNKQIVFQYSNEKGVFCGYPFNPNGSVENIAGITDDTGRILGLMPHPERHISYLQHPRWTAARLRREGDGLQVFRNGVDYAKKYL